MERSRELYQRIIDGGEAIIDIFIEDRESEALFLDFKRSTDNGCSKKLHPNDRKNLSKCISGFRILSVDGQASPE